ncbi:FIST signal transduction protein [Colwelliaceae bacterium MEBiC 14330]
MDTELFTWHTYSNTLDDLKQGLLLAQKSYAKSLLMLTCNQNNYCEAALNSLLKTCNLPIFGGIYPMVILQDRLLEQGAVIIGFKEKFDTSYFSRLQLISNDDCLETMITETLEQKNYFSGHDSFLMFYDALTNNVEDFIDCLFECLDHNVNVAGGGAGNLDLIQRPCIFSNQGLLSNTLLLVTLPKKLNTSVAHGWDIFQGPYLVSDAQNQTVKSLNYQPAFKVYNQTISAKTDHQFTEDNFLDIAKNYPLGIKDINNNLIIRDPILTENNHLKCVGNIPINSMVYLLKTDNETLISSAKRAAIEVANFDKKITIVFDCISRMLYLGEHFNEELLAIAEHCSTPVLFGVLSFGEIANSQSGAIRLFNKSTIIGSW